jgi:hypothetical protein
MEITNPNIPNIIFIPIKNKHPSRQPPISKSKKNINFGQVIKLHEKITMHTEPTKLFFNIRQDTNNARGIAGKNKPVISPKNNISPDTIKEIFLLRLPRAMFSLSRSLRTSSSSSIRAVLHFLHNTLLSGSLTISSLSYIGELHLVQSVSGMRADR